MGYPMTFKRFINRNQLQDGDYWHLPKGFPSTNWNIENLDVPTLVKVLNDVEHWVKNFAGDLRRLEQDTVDEQATCKHIAARTGLEADVVAAVLKEYIDW